MSRTPPRTEKEVGIGRVGHAAGGTQAPKIQLPSRRTMILLVVLDALGVFGCEVAGR